MRKKMARAFIDALKKSDTDPYVRVHDLESVAIDGEVNLLEAMDAVLDAIKAGK